MSFDLEYWDSNEKGQVYRSFKQEREEIWHAEEVIEAFLREHTTATTAELKERVKQAFKEKQWYLSEDRALRALWNLIGRDHVEIVRTEKGNILRWVGK